ncbi:Isochorismatase hydrolase [Xylaria sp. CBS 124048]|nr:Isochorismatase hydrolase [Xylaria sp. CBS 124048]
MILLRAISATATTLTRTTQVSRQSLFRFPHSPLRLGSRLSSSTMASSQVPSRRLQHPVVFVCDLQDKFRNAIWQFDKVLLTTQKVLRAAQILKIPIFVTTQNAPKLGGVVPELLPFLETATLQTDKTLFSMVTPTIRHHPLIATRQDETETEPETETETETPKPKREVVIVGIESHICVTQTALDLLSLGHTVYVLADGVSSCNAQEIPVALDRLRHAGAVVTTSESWLYEVVGDAGIAEFREVARLVKEVGAETKMVLKGLLGG